MSADLLARYAERVERALAAFLPAENLPPQRLHAAMRYATLNGGKRLRAALVYATGEALGAPAERLDGAACALELMHAYSLVHDDLPCMDDDDLRRGRPTCHKAFDEATALLVGDALQTAAFAVLAHDANVAAGARVRMLATLASAAGAGGMAGGQAIDLAAVGRTLTPAELSDMHARKTGALIVAAVLLGAHAAGTRAARTVAALTRFAQALGLAFQIMDDVLDVAGNTAALGKTAGADQARNKPTFATLLGVDAARAEAHAAHARALECLAFLGDNGRPLAQIADFVIGRTH